MKIKKSCATWRKERHETDINVGGDSVGDVRHSRVACRAFGEQGHRATGRCACEMRRHVGRDRQPAEREGHHGALRFKWATNECERFHRSLVSVMGLHVRGAESILARISTFALLLLPVSSTLKKES